MPDRMDPDADPSCEVDIDVATQAPAANEQAPDHQPRWRRPTLLVAGVSLLSLGALLNADRFDRKLGDDASELAQEERVEEPTLELAIAAEPEEAGGFGTRHMGEEGKLGKPTATARPGVYAMKGPSTAAPATPRRYEQRPQGLIGTGGGGIGGRGYGLGSGAAGQGLVGYLGSDAIANERYAELPSNPFVSTADDAKSTFSIDVDTASYANVRRYLLSEHQLPPPAAVRTEELINYFDYDYGQPSGEAPFSLITEVGPSPWNPENRLVHVGVQGKVIAAGETPVRNLVFLLDVSGSMESPDKLPLVKHGLAELTEILDEDDRVSIVVYAGAAGVVLPPTSGANKRAILDALDQLEGGGSTNGGEGIELAYALAERNFVEGGVNRVLLATDGDFNVGVSSHDELIKLIEKKRESGVFLSVLGFGRDNLNDHTMEQLADKGNGNYSYLDGMFEARKVLVAEAGSTLVTIAKDVKIQVEFDPDQVAQHRLIGYENRVMAHHEFDDDRKDAGEIGAGHSVTAIYEITPVAKNKDSAAPLMQLDLRYKQPDQDQSRKISVAVDDSGRALDGTSTDYRFAAAVAAFAERLRGEQGLSYAQILALAQGSMGADTQCYRHQFLELIGVAAELSGESIEQFDSSCTPVSVRSRPGAVANDIAQGEDEPSEQEEHGWQAFVLEVLRLLPPFLALPMFVMAMRKPRRKR